MKTCTKCGIEQPLTNYFLKERATGRLHAQCKLCYKEHRKSYMKQHYAQYGDEYRMRAKARRLHIRNELHVKMRTYMSDKACIDCGETDFRVLEFDHVDPKSKSFGIARAVTDGYKWEKILKEISKCEVVCANCHKKRTAEQFGWFRSLN